jgi:hypothetical protein
LRIDTSFFQLCESRPSVGILHLIRREAHANRTAWQHFLCWSDSFSATKLILHELTTIKPDFSVVKYRAGLHQYVAMKLKRVPNITVTSQSRKLLKVGYYSRVLSQAILINRFEYVILCCFKKSRIGRYFCIMPQETGFMSTATQRYAF